MTQKPAEKAAAAQAAAGELVESLIRDAADAARRLTNQMGENHPERTGARRALTILNGMLRRAEDRDRDQEGLWTMRRVVLRTHRSLQTLERETLRPHTELSQQSGALFYAVLRGDAPVQMDRDSLMQRAREMVAAREVTFSEPAHEAWYAVLEGTHGEDAAMSCWIQHHIPGGLPGTTTSVPPGFPPGMPPAPPGPDGPAGRNAPGLPVADSPGRTGAPGPWNPGIPGAPEYLETRNARTPVTAVPTDKNPGEKKRP